MIPRCRAEHLMWRHHHFGSRIWDPERSKLSYGHEDGVSVIREMIRVIVCSRDEVALQRSRGMIGKGWRNRENNPISSPLILPFGYPMKRPLTHSLTVILCQNLVEQFLCLYSQWLALFTVCFYFHSSLSCTDLRVSPYSSCYLSLSQVCCI